jgi:hypothetical protein
VSLRLPPKVPTQEFTPRFLKEPNDPGVEAGPVGVEKIALTHKIP